MKNLKVFSRAVRQEIARISISLKQLEFRILRVRGSFKKKLREELQEIKRMKEAVLNRLYSLTEEARLHVPTMQEIRGDIDTLHTRCRLLKSQHI